MPAVTSSMRAPFCSSTSLEREGFPIVATVPSASGPRAVGMAKRSSEPGAPPPYF